MSTYRGYLSGLSIMQGIVGKRVHNQGTTQHFVSTVMGTLYMDEKILRYVEKVTVWDEKIDVELKGNVKNTAEKAD